MDESGESCALRPYLQQDLIDMQLIYFVFCPSREDTHTV